MQDVHRQLSTACFNQCWTYIEKKDRSEEDVEAMLLLACASLWHWKQRTDCQPSNLSVGYWQVSRVHALAGQPAMARMFGEKCLRIGEAEHLAPFYVGYAFEALARAALVQRESSEATRYLAEARTRLAAVTDPESRGFLESDLNELDVLARTEDKG